MKLFEGENIGINFTTNSHDIQLLHVIILSNNGNLNPLKTNLSKIKLNKKSFDRNKVLVISGKLPNWLLSYLILKLSFVKALAVFNPTSGAKIIKCDNTNIFQNGIIPAKLYKSSLLKLIDSKESAELKINNPGLKLPKLKKIAILGSPNSGKSVFCRAMLKQLKINKDVKFKENFFLLRACPDGEGDWYGNIPATIGRIFRIKKKFDNDYVKAVIKSIKNSGMYKKIILIDCGGKISEENQKILKECTHSIIICKDEKDYDKWEEASEAADVDILAKVKSKLGNGLSKSTGLNKYIIYNLKRENNCIEIPKQLIQQVLN